MRNLLPVFRPFYLLFLLPMAIAVVGCGGDASVEQKEIPDSSADASVVSQLPEKDLANFEAFVAERKASGDTLAIDHERLEKVFPDQITGYTIDVDKASTFETKRFGFSEAIRVFYNENEDYIEFILGDYVADPAFFEVILQRYNEARGTEIEGVVEKKVSNMEMYPENATDFFTWSLFNSESKVARLYIGVDFRFLLTIEATNQNDHLNPDQFPIQLSSLFE